MWFGVMLSRRRRAHRSHPGDHGRAWLPMGHTRGRVRPSRLRAPARTRASAPHRASPTPAGRGTWHPDPATRCATTPAAACRKGAVTPLAASLAQNLMDREIRVNCVAPGPVWTPLIPATFDEERVESFGKSAPMGRAADPDEIAPSSVFFASSRLSSHYTGRTLVPARGEIHPGCWTRAVTTLGSRDTDGGGPARASCVRGSTAASAAPARRPGWRDGREITPPLVISRPPTGIT